MIIGSLKNLEYLEVFRNKVTDISCLAGLPHLLDLNIVENYISDLTPLTQIKTLKRLWIHDCNQKKRSEPTAETLQMLRSALPDCYIDAVSSNTGGGWREHPHFDVIYKMFRARTYMPFEDSWPDDETGN